jgi:hypothetical protein
MIVYWIMFLVPAFAAVAPLRASPQLRELLWALLGLILIVLIGLRFEVGGDWIPYLRKFESTESQPLSQSLSLYEPAYSFLSWVSARIGGGIYLVNLICGSVLVCGLVRFIKRQPYPWLALVIAIPYLVIVVAMGYTRQSAAIGFEFLAIVALLDKRFGLFLTYVFLGSLFHRSAALLMPLGLITNQTDWSRFFWAVVSFSLVFAVFTIQTFLSLWSNYVEGDVNSAGGSIRIAMNAVPAILMICYGTKISPDESERTLWMGFAVLSIICVPLVFIASTAVDRIALYFIPIQIYVLSRLPILFKDKLIRTVIVIAIVMYYALVEFVWLNFSPYAQGHVPYRFLLFQSL